MDIPDSGKVEKSYRYFKIKNLEAKTAQVLIKVFIYKNTLLQTDKSTTFLDLPDCIDVHVREISGTNEGNVNLKWIHIALINLKKHLLT